MKYLLFLLATLCTLSATSQTNTCAKIKARGFTQEFCDYDKKNAYKNVTFGAPFDVVSSKFTLTKSETNPNNYISKADDAAFWGKVKFDQCLFEFNSDKQLTGVQLQMIGYGSTDTEKKNQNLSAWSHIKDYLTNLFGKPEMLHESFLWRGENIYIVLGGYNSKTNADGSGALAIFTKNINPIDGL